MAAGSNARICWLCMMHVAARGMASAGTQATIGGVPIYNYDPTAVSIMSHAEQEWILVAKPEVSDKQLQTLCHDGAHCTATGHPSEGGLGLATVRATFAKLETLAKKHKSELLFMEPSMPVGFIDEEPELSLLEESTDIWGLDRIDDRKGLDGSYKPSGDGEGVHVYVMDTGIRTTHQDLGGRAIPTLDVTSGDVVVCSSDDIACAADGNGHGTHCAGTVGGKKYGVAKATTLHAVKVLSDKGSGSTAGVVAAMDWIVQNHQKPSVMSMSLGGPGVSQAYKYAVDAAIAKGITVVVAAGNNKDSACKFSPSFVPGAITVGATDQKDVWASFSNFGSCVDIFAPGVHITSAWYASDTDEATISGTSMACPHVAGGVALLLQKNPSMSVPDVVSHLNTAATQGAVSRVACEDKSASYCAKQKAAGLCYKKMWQVYCRLSCGDCGTGAAPDDFTRDFSRRLLFVGTGAPTPRPTASPPTTQPPTTSQPTSPPSDCKDMVSSCAKQAAAGNCHKSSNKKYCKLSCGYCGSDTSTTPAPTTPKPTTPKPTSPPSDCKDKSASYCAKQKAAGGCKRAFIADNYCRRSCGNCGSSGPTTPNPTTPKPTSPPSDCKDKSASLCAKQAAAGNCKKAFIADNYCRRSCGNCPSPTPSPDKSTTAAPPPDKSTTAAPPPDKSTTAEPSPAARRRRIQRRRRRRVTTVQSQLRRRRRRDLSR